MTRVLPCVTLALSFFTGLACGQEETMDLELTLDLDRPSYLQGESIRMHMTLRNAASEPRTLASMGLDGSVVGAVLLDPNGREIDTYHWVDVEMRLGENLPGFDRVAEMEFQPGQTDETTRNLLHLREDLEPGDYQLQGRYDWNDVSMRSEPVSFSVRPWHPRQFALAHDWSTGEPEHLLFAWVDTWQGSPLLMEGASFEADHRVRDHVDRVPDVEVGDSVDGLKIAVNFDDAAPFHSTLLWRNGARLCWRTLGPGVAAGSGATRPDLEPWEFAGMPVREDDTATAVLLRNPSGSTLLALSILSDGTSREIARQDTGGATHTALLHHPRMGSIAVFVADRGGRRVVEWVALGREGGGQLVTTGSRVLALATGLDRSFAPRVIAALAGDDAPAGRMSVLTLRFEGVGLAEGPDGPRWDLPANSEVRLLLGTEGSVFALVRDPDGGFWRGDPDGTVAALASDDLPLHPFEVLVGRRDLPFAFGAAAGGGTRLVPLVEFAPPGANE